MTRIDDDTNKNVNYVTINDKNLSVIDGNAETLNKIKDYFSKQFKQIQTDNNNSFFDPKLIEKINNMKEQQIFTNKTDAINDYRADAAMEMSNSKSYSLEPAIPSKNYRAEFANYEPSNKYKYNKVYNMIYKNPNLSNKADAKYIANMVCKLSDDYGMDPEIIVCILSRESNFVFTSRVLDRKGSQYKGCMQVGPEILEILYANPSDKSKYVASHKRYCMQDQKRIDELKSAYPTWQSLYNAIKSNVALGLEVGIMAYKIKLVDAEGKTEVALGKYCKNQYHFPKDSTAVSRIYPIPTYSRTNINHTA